MNDANTHGYRYACFRRRRGDGYLTAEGARDLAFKVLTFWPRTPLFSTQITARTGRANLWPRDHSEVWRHG